MGVSETVAGGARGEEVLTTFKPEPKKGYSLEAAFQENCGVFWVVRGWVPNRFPLGPWQCLCAKPLPSALRVHQHLHWPHT